jgi:hypothetical protein
MFLGWLPRKRRITITSFTLQKLKNNSKIIKLIISKISTTSSQRGRKSSISIFSATKHRNLRLKAIISYFPTVSRQPNGT